MTHIVRLATCAVALLLAFATFALLPRTAAAQGDGKKAEISYIDRGDIGTLDPNRMSWAQDIRVGQALYEGLYATDPVTFEPVLATADRVSVSEDKKVWTFHIRDTAHWSNGDPDDRRLRLRLAAHARGAGRLHLPDRRIHRGRQ